MRGEAGGVVPGHKTPITRVLDCCARAASGHVVATAMVWMKSRRRICLPQGSEQGIVAGQTGRLEVVKTALGNVRFRS